MIKLSFSSLHIFSNISCFLSTSTYVLKPFPIFKKYKQNDATIILKLIIIKKEKVTLTSVIPNIEYLKAFIKYNIGFIRARSCQIPGNIDIEKNIPPKYVNGVIINVGITFMSSQSFANKPFKNPHIENKVEDKVITVSINNIL